MEIIEDKSQLISSANKKQMKLTYSQTSELKLKSFPNEIILTNSDPVIFTTWVRKMREAIMESNGS
jgi:hypothetical protein